MDFVPQPTETTYEGFEDLLDRMNVWLREMRDVQVINMQSVMVQKHDGKTRCSRRWQTSPPSGVAPWWVSV